MDELLPLVWVGAILGFVYGMLATYLGRAFRGRRLKTSFMRPARRVMQRDPDAPAGELLKAFDVFYRQSGPLQRRFPELVDLMKHVYLQIHTPASRSRDAWSAEEVGRFVEALNVERDRVPFRALSGELQSHFNAVRTLCEGAGVPNWREPLLELAKVVRLQHERMASQQTSLRVSWTLTAVGLLLTILFGAIGIT